MYIRGLLTALKSRNKSLMYRMSMDAKAFINIHFYHAAEQCGLVEALREPCSREVLLEKLDVAREDLLDFLLDMGLAAGALTRQGEKYKAKGPWFKGLMSEDGDGVAGFIEAFVTYYNSMYRDFSDRLKGKAKDADLAAIGTVIARVSRLIEPYALAFIEKMVPAGPLSVMDVGCGSGGYLWHCSKLNPESGGMGLEKDSEVAALAAQNLNDWGLSGRFRIENGDLLGLDPESEPGFDLLFYFNNIYYFPEKERPEVFRRMNGLLADSGKLLIINQFQGMGKDLFAANLNLATTSLDGCWPLPDLDCTTSQLEEAGFEDIAVVRLMPGSTFYGIAAEKK